MAGKLVAIVISLLLVGAETAEAFRVLVFTKTVRSPHASRADGIALVKELAFAHGFEADFSTDSGDFTDANLSRYAAIIFMNTGGDVLNGSQEGALRRYIQNGGGWVGVHAAAVTETGWAWYRELIGAIFDNHPAQQFATIRVEVRDHPSTAHLADPWIRWDEWYNYRSNPRPEVTVLLTLDESTYSGGTMGADHPIAWYHEYDGGRAWYTGLGHTSAAYREPDFQQHLLGGILYAAGATDREKLVRCRTVVPRGSVWRFWDRGQDLGTAWQAPDYNDSDWPSGPGKLGFGNGNDVTPVDPGPMEDRHRTTYFRHRFRLDDSLLVTGLHLEVLRDDGAVIYLNGTEIARSNIEDGEVSYETFAGDSAETGDRFVAIDATAFAGSLRAGENVLAVELHQSEMGDSDLGFDLALAAELVDPPQIEIAPAAGGQFEISWRAEYSAVYRAVLEQSGSLAEWTPVDGEAILRGGRASQTVPGADQSFFRLRYRLPAP